MSRTGADPVVAGRGRSKWTRFADPRGIGLPLVLVLIALVGVDAVLTLGGIGQQVPGSPLTSDLPLGIRSATGLVAAVVAGSIAIVAKVLWLRRTWCRRRAWVTVLTFLVASQAGVVASRAVSGTADAAASSAGVPLDRTALLLGVMLASHLLLGVIGRHRDALTDLRDAEERLRAAIEGGASALADERRGLAAQVRELLMVRLGAAAPERSAITGPQMKALVDEVLRPLSHRLTGEGSGFVVPESAQVGRASVDQVLRSLRHRPVVRPRLLTTVMVLLTFRLGLIYVPPEDLPPSGVRISVDWASLIGAALQHAAVLVVMLAGSRTIARRLAGRSGEPLARTWTWTLVALVTLGVAAFGVLRVAHLLPGFATLRPATIGAALGFTLPLVLLTLGATLLEATEEALRRSEEAQVTANLGLAQQVARIDALLTHERRRFARRLHSTVQAAVNAAALILERDARSDEAVMRAAELVDTAVAGLDADDAVPTVVRLSGIVRAWEDLCTVSIDSDDVVLGALDGDPPARDAIWDLVAEACQNAVVHGRSRNVNVRLRLLAEHAVSIRVEDDGVGAARAGATGGSGLGTRVLSTTCTEWSLESGAHGTVLTATLPLG